MLEFEAEAVVAEPSSPVHIVNSTHYSFALAVYMSYIVSKLLMRMGIIYEHKELEVRQARQI